MTTRKGLTTGSGRKGYYNVIGTDPRVHKQSAMGIKQPQRMPYLHEKHGGKGEFCPSMLTDIDATLFKYSRLKDKSNLTTKEKRDLNRLENKVEKVKVSKQLKNYMKQHRVAIISAAAGVGLIGMNLLSPPQHQDSFTAALMFAYPVGYIAYENTMMRKMESHEFDRLNKLLPDVPKETKEQLAIRSVRKKWFGGKSSQKEECPQVYVYHNGEVYRVKGGKLPFGRQGIDVFELPEENAIYIPSTNKQQMQISDAEMEQRKEETENFLSKLYGGYTRFEDSGGYYDSELKKVIKEKGVKVVSFSSKSDATDKKKSMQLKRFLIKKQKDWGQQTMGSENEGDLYYINKRKIVKK